MGKKRRLSSTPQKTNTNHIAEKEKRKVEKPTSRQSKSNTKLDEGYFEERAQDIVEPDIHIEEEKDEVGEARFRFYGALKGLTDKKEDSESESSLFDEEEQEDEDMYSESQFIIHDKVRQVARRYQDKDNSFGFTSSNKFLAGLESDSRDDSRVAGDNSLVTKQSYVMKLFDRSVDLAQFDDATPLYPICRSWVANQPKKPWEKKKEVPPVPTWAVKEETEEDPEAPISKREEEEEKKKLVDDSEIKPDQIELKVIAKLPPPAYMVDVNAANIRIPQPLPKFIDEDNELLPDEDKSVDELPSQDDLLAGHLCRWSQVKTSWLHASQKNEERYLKSRQLLQMMYNRSQKQSAQ